MSPLSLLIRSAFNPKISPSSAPTSPSSPLAQTLRAQFEGENPTPFDRYQSLLAQHGGDFGEAFNAVDSARSGAPIPSSLGTISPEDLVEVDRIAQGADVPISGLIAPIYEGLKGLEQNTPIKALSAAYSVLGPLGVPVDRPGANTSPAKLSHVTAALKGSGYRLLQSLGLID